MLIPPFELDGLLPRGDYEVSFNELRQSILVQGPTGAANWDKAWRLKLVNNLEVLTRQLWAVGIRDVFADDRLLKIRTIQTISMDTSYATCIR